MVEALSEALRRVTDEVSAERIGPADAAGLWARGRRRRRQRLTVAALGALAVAGVIVGVLWPAIPAPTNSRPAVSPPSAEITGYPTYVAHPWRLEKATRVDEPMVAVIETGNPPVLVAQDGRVFEVDLVAMGLSAHVPAGPSRLSPDGKWLASGFALVDLTRGVIVDRPYLARYSSTDRDSIQAPLWNPSSTAVFVPALDRSGAGSSGVVLGRSGDAISAPLLPGRLDAAVAGWLDDETLIAYSLDAGKENPRLGQYRWRPGDREWTPNPGGDIVGLGAAAAPFTFLMSPDGARVLVTFASDSRPGPDGSMMWETIAGQVYSTASGKAVGFRDDSAPVPNTAYEFWPADRNRGFAWFDGHIVTTGQTTQTLGGQQLVEVSDEFITRRISFAGDQIRGEQVSNATGLWGERFRRYILPGLALLVLFGLVRLVLRVRRG